MKTKFNQESARHRQNRTRKRPIECMEDRKLKHKLLLRVQHGLRETTMSIDELSRSSNVSRTTIYRIKSCDGHSKARLHTLNLLLKTLNGNREQSRDSETEGAESLKRVKEKDLFLKWLESIHTDTVHSFTEQDYHAFRELANRYFRKR